MILCVIKKRVSLSLRAKALLKLSLRNGPTSSILIDMDEGSVVAAVNLAG